MTHGCDASWEREHLSAEPQPTTRPLGALGVGAQYLHGHTAKREMVKDKHIDKNKQNKNQPYPSNLFLFLPKIGFCVFLFFYYSGIALNYCMTQAANDTGYCILMAPPYCLKK